ncbi:ketopantoate reductase family protein [Salinicola acroporae]|uniref:ketopantoate reductase family protein n=1 Tax=Salinicola acroporae TaxID=1541440 RepID=UPI001F0B9816|nr:2-dehydropantoate 2-reductase [Salinicola acroporae]
MPPTDDGSWLIVGAGALGQLFAASLARRFPIVLLGRQAAESPIHLRRPDGETLRIAVPRQRPAAWAADRTSTAVPTLVVLATKSHDAMAALDALAPRLAPATPLLLVQNGFRTQPAISERWAGPVLCASTTEAAYRPPPGPQSPDVVHAATGTTWIGDLADHHFALATSVARRLDQAGIAATPCRDIRRHLWHKLAVNAVINPLTACHRVPNGALARPAFRPRVTALVAEIERIMHAEGVAPPPQGWQALIDGVIQATASNHSSMLQDVLANRPTEHDAILGPLVEASLRHRLDAPELQALWRAASA